MKANGQLDKRGDWLRVVMVVMAIVLRGLWKKIECAGSNQLRRKVASVRS